MAFLIYFKEKRDEKLIYKNANESYKLAGWQLIYSLWEKRNRPIKIGWTVLADEILKTHNPNYSSETQSLVIDFHPNSKERIGLIEIDKIHLFTYGDEQNAYWTPMMLELNSVFYNDEYENLTKETKNEIIAEIEPIEDGARFFEFLYLNGNEYSWNWGRNGMTNAAFIYDDARKYFSTFFANGV